MSEKRFKLSDWCGEQNVSNVIDIEKQTHLINVEVVELLNEQQDQISKLQANVEYLIDSKKELIEKIGEQQATIRKLQDLCGESDGENAKLRIENKKLKEENEQLKISLNEYGVDFSAFEIFKESIGYNEMIKSSSIKNKKVVR